MRSVLLTIALVFFIPGAAVACPLCFASSGSGTLYGFYLSTLLLTLMPFALIALVAFFAFADRRVRSAAAPNAAPTKLGRQAGKGEKPVEAAFADTAD